MLIYYRRSSICIKLFFIKTVHGRSEVLEYINQLKQHKNIKETKIKLAKITGYIDFLSKSGLSMGYPYLKHLTDDIWELRPLRDRILFAYWNNNSFIILSHFFKQTQKTPKREIERAKRYLEDYKKRR